MPDRRRHRGPHPDDARAFGHEHEPVLRTAVADLSWLLTRGYADAAATKLVGDRFQLTARQRLAVRRCACTDAQRRGRSRTRLSPAQLRGLALGVDGFNVLITIEAALAGGVVLRGRDGCLRDMASMHGSWKRVIETPVAVAGLFALLADVGVAEVTVVLDRPVGNSGRLAAVIRMVAAGFPVPCEVCLSLHADRDLCASAAVVATADSAVIDHVSRWTDLASAVVARELPGARVLDLGRRQGRTALATRQAHPTA